MPENTVKYDALQPLTKTQIEKNEAYIAKLQENKKSRWDIPEGTELTWEMRITPEFAIIYSDPVEDYNPWYEAWPDGPGESPFGGAIAPPLLLGYWAFWFYGIWAGGRGGAPDGVAVSFDSQIIEPCPLGTLVRYRGRLAKKYIKRGRQYVRIEITVEDAETGKLLFKHAQETLAKYAKVEENGGK
ncbi:hypothetical protein ACFLU9_01165 [Chloroflexota bacterium]